MKDNLISRREFLYFGAKITLLGASLLSCRKDIKLPEFENKDTRGERFMIIDTHTHFYDPNRPQGVPWPDLNDKVLYKQVLPKHYKELAIPQGVTGTIVVEASEWVEDNQWILDLAENETFIVGFVGNLQPGIDDFSKNLDRFSVNPIFRGIRPRGANIRNFEKTEFLNDIEKLVKKDLEIDLLIIPSELSDVAFLAKKIPELRIVINHIAGVCIDGKSPNTKWTDGIYKVAEYQNVYCKVSGLPEATRLIPAPKDLDFYIPTLDVLWKAFGEDRLIYGSNWPVSERFADYATIQNLVMEYFKAKGNSAVEKYFWKNAKSAYKWIDR